MVASSCYLGHHLQRRTSRPSVGAFTAQEFHFADFTLDHSRYRLQRGEDILRLEKRPMELLILLVERRGELVSREDIAERLWGKDVFLDVDRSTVLERLQKRQAHFFPKELLDSQLATLEQPHDAFVVDANRPIDEVVDSIVKVVLEGKI